MSSSIGFSFDGLVPDLLRSAVVGCVGMVVVLGVLKVWPSLSANVRAWLWRLAGLKFLVALFAVMPLAVLPSKSRVPDDIVPSDASRMVNPHVEAWPVPRVAVTKEATAPTAAERKVSAIDVLGLVWLLGALGMLGRLVHQHLCLRRFRAEVLAAGGRGRRGRHRSGTIQIVTARLIGTPLLIDGLSPIIALPPGLHGVERAAAIQHEWAHFRRHDAIWNLFLRLVGAIFWFMPPIWWIGTWAARAAEEACDQVALHRSGIEPSAYASLLVRFSTSRPMSVAIALSSAAGAIAQRIHAMKPDHKRPSHRSWFVMIPLCLLGLVPWVAVGKPLTILPMAQARDRKPPDEAALIDTFALQCAWLLNDADVQADLRLTDVQKAAFERARTHFNVQIRWLGSQLQAQKEKNVSDNDRAAFDYKNRPRIFRDSAEEVLGILDVKQRERIEQIALNVHGGLIILHPEIAQRLAVTPVQLAKIYSIDKKYRRRMDERWRLLWQTYFPRTILDRSRLSANERASLSRIDKELPSASGDRRAQLTLKHDNLVLKMMHAKASGTRMPVLDRIPASAEDASMKLDRQDRKAEGEDILKVLTLDQRAKFELLKGAPFKTHNPLYMEDGA